MFEQKARKRRAVTASALFVLQGGEVVAESYDGDHTPDGKGVAINPSSRFNVYSVRKTYIGLAVSSLLLTKRLLSLDTALSEILPSPDPSLFEGTTIRHLLTHTHGLDEHRGRLYRRFAAGTRWHYTNTGNDLLCQVFFALTRHTVREWLQDHVWTPLGFRESGFESEVSGALVQDVYSPSRGAPMMIGKDDGAGRNLYVSARELAAWGYLHLHAGVVGPNQLLPRELFAPVIQEQTPATLDRRYPRHGFFWWLQKIGVRANEIGARVPQGAFQIVGMSGCVCLVIPSLDVVAVRMHNSLGGRLTFVHETRAFGDAVVAALQPSV
ncbi:MAG: serine hydrolase [Firmicutes bacterium]|nr:serine hydrolase [Bacillota bacterium]